MLDKILECNKIIILEALGLFESRASVMVILSNFSILGIRRSVKIGNFDKGYQQGRLLLLLRF